MFDQNYIVLILLLLISFKYTLSLKHHLVLNDDPRVYATVSSFGYLRDGRLDVIVQNLTLWPDPSEIPQGKFGFILIRSPDHMRNPYLMEENFDTTRNTCMETRFLNRINVDTIKMSIDPDKSKVIFECSGKQKLPAIIPLPSNSKRNNHDSHASYIHRYSKRAIVISSSSSLSPPLLAPANSLPLSSSSSSSSLESNYNDDNFIPEKMHREEFSTICPNTEDLPLVIKQDYMGRNTYGFNFTMRIQDELEEGFYYLMFHNCRGRRAMGPHETSTRFNLSMLIYEKNYPEIYLSAGLIPLPQMYFVLSVMFFLIGCIWLNFISRQKDSTLRIHHLMSLLVFAKSCSLLFHGINYHYIALYGQPVVTWAYLYYATRSIKGALFFITLVLIGTGWSFIKHILSAKDKRIILFVVGLQVIAHIAEIVFDESTEGQISYEVSAQICSLVDLICCLAILYPISLSVRHLEEASKTDGKAAINLKKLELFKRFYIISTIYIYITRIVSFIFLSILTYRYSWLADLVSEFATLIYFITTGYYFQPMPTNPYLLLSSDNDLEEDILFSVDNPELSQMEDRNTLLDEGKKVTRRLMEEDIV